MEPTDDDDLIGRPTPVHELVAGAVSEAATAYAEDGRTDVVRHLRDVLAARSIATGDEAWLEETARRIRSGHRLDLDDPRGGGLPEVEEISTIGE